MPTTLPTVTLTQQTPTGLQIGHVPAVSIANATNATLLVLFGPSLQGWVGPNATVWFVQLDQQQTVYDWIVLTPTFPGSPVGTTCVVTTYQGTDVIPPLGVGGTNPLAPRPGLGQAFPSASVIQGEIAYNAVDFGADPTGVIDSTLFLQQCAEAVAARGGGVMYCPRGRYLVHLTKNVNLTTRFSFLHVRSNVRVVGDGAGTEFFLAAGQAQEVQGMITNWNPTPSSTDHNIGFADFVLNGNALNQASVPNLDHCDGFNIQYATGLSFTRVYSKNNYGVSNGANGPGGQSGESHQFLIQHSTILFMDACQGLSDDGGNASTCFGISESFDVHLSNCSAHDTNKGLGFPLFACSYVTLTNCHAFNLVDNGFLVEVSNQVNLVGCQAGGVTPPFFVAQPYAINTSLPVKYGFVCSGSYDVQHVGCITLNATVSGFNCQDEVGQSQVENRRIRYVGCTAEGALSHGFAVTGSGADYSFTECTALNAGSRGFLMQSSSATGQHKFTNCRALSCNIGFQIDATPLPFSNMVNCEGLNNTTQAIFGGVSVTKINGTLSAPAFPTSTTAFANPFPFAVTVHILGGTVTGVAVDGGTVATATSATTPVTTRLPAGKSITLTYSVVPTSWVWVGD